MGGLSLELNAALTSLPECKDDVPRVKLQFAPDESSLAESTKS
jgi:hypothetical protein